ncbi:2-succinyl-5-enolpyruvyl-6-hydroxy-3-cyclohexene-1-carboxylate synthase [Mangrovimonas spongiae]|uniref:2-succinyl-5-enolpyruvyl-6-hydroxy-3-cyclohexene-1-carboxylate synthase n=1 Tax=Mangrovimonas spongiae TaxID=2494697 RepID=A0A3R9M6U5_9FLAO|nr:thiamine pyrophosphate-binding protein [Mangrovimonas spongiae]RSK38604.1 2-succinyl-5-enolpyruvyl-6-hydroxy-3-cyclohexene-1-carboxylate synthase [Mangrovimonas spongiae]
MNYPKIPLAQTVVQLCKAKNIKHIVISPGSRSAPLTIGFTEDDYFTCYSIVDERSAAFFAMGIAQNIKHPVALVCSSGSALLNYYPAIAEAFYSHIPLVVLSADRPEYLIGIGDGQTINQPEVYKNHILYSANLKLDLEDTPKRKSDDEPIIIKNIENRLERFLGLKQEIQKENEEAINLAINKAIVKNGPVHINVPFEEPLYDMVQEPTVMPKNIPPKEISQKIDATILKDLVTDWSNATKKMVLVGVNPKDSIDERWLNDLAEDDSVLVFTETTSNIHHKAFFPSIDKMIWPLNDDELEQLQPDILLTFGGLIVSKKVKAFLRKYQPKHHWHIDAVNANDTFFCLENHIKVSPNSFFSAFLPQLTHHRKSNYKTTWKSVKKHRKLKHSSYLEQISYSDFSVYNKVFQALPDHSVMQLSNSSTIRYSQLFDLNKTIEVHCNRGTSGIDGSMSTAVGFASSTTKQTTFITGDLSFFYDSNALWNNYIPKNFRIILVNNSGGGIFRILPGHKNTANFDHFFETKHELSAKYLCEMYGFEYNTAKNIDELEESLNNFFNTSNQPKLLEVFTPRTINDDVLLNYFKFIK